MACGNAALPEGEDLGWTSVKIPGKPVDFSDSRTGGWDLQRPKMMRAGACQVQPGFSVTSCMLCICFDNQASLL